MSNDLPIDSSYVPFAHYSYCATNDLKNQKFQSQIKQRNIIIGAYNDSIAGFYELIVDNKDNKTNSINYKSFKNDYNKKMQI